MGTQAQIETSDQVLRAVIDNKRRARAKGFKTSADFAGPISSKLRRELDETIAFFAAISKGAA